MCENPKVNVMRRRHVVLGLGALAVASVPVQAEVPVPGWRPDFVPDLDEIAQTFQGYANNAHDFVLWRNSTCCIVPNGMSEQDAIRYAGDLLTDITAYHPDMTPQTMQDGNVMVFYSHDAYNVVPAAFAKTHWDTIESRHLEGLTPNEVLITPLGRNVFDALGKTALLGRSYLFMDAALRDVDRIVRAG